MKALCWFGKEDVRVEKVPDPEILNPKDAIVQISTTAICGSDLHLYDGMIPTMQPGDILGHEFMGHVVDVGSEVKKLQVGDRVVVPFTISCSSCYYCKRGLWSLCDNSNPNSWLAEGMWGHSPAGLYGYSHTLGGYAGGQAEYARVPFADSGPIRVPDAIPDDQLVMLADVLPTGWMAAENCDIEPGDIVAVWGCGPVGLFAIQSAYMLGAEKVIAIDRLPERLRLARDECHADVINFEEVEDVVEELKLRTGGRGPDSCIDAVGSEAHPDGKVSAVYDRVRHAVRAETDRPTALRELIQACRKGGTISIPGVYGGLIDKVPIGAAFNKGLSFRMGQTHVQKYMPSLLERIEDGEIDPSFIVTHRLTLDEAPQGYRTFRDKEEECIKVLLRP